MTTDRIKLSLFQSIAENLQIGYYGTWVIGSSEFYQCKRHFSFEPLLFNSEILEGVSSTFSQSTFGRILTSGENGKIRFAILIILTKAKVEISIGEWR